MLLRLRALPLVPLLFGTIAAAGQGVPPAAPQAPPAPTVTLQRPADVTYPSGRATIAYSLTQAAGVVEIDILWPRSDVVAGWTGGPAAEKTAGRADRFTIPEASTVAGTHSINWDLRANGYFAVGPPGVPARFTPGPLVPPGTYTVRVSALGETRTETFQVAADPPVSPEAQAALEARFVLAMRVRGSASAASAAIARARSLRARIASKLETTSDAGLAEDGKSLLRRLDAMEGADFGTGSSPWGLVAAHAALAALLGELNAAESAPSDLQRARFRTLAAALQTQVAGLNALTNGAYARWERGESSVSAKSGAGSDVPWEPSSPPIPGLVPPLLISGGKPTYPLLAQSSKVQGTVILEGTVGVDGAVTDIKVRQSVDPVLDREAILALEKWRFTPAMLKGQPVPVVIKSEMKFELKLDEGPR